MTRNTDVIIANGYVTTRGVKISEKCHLVIKESSGLIRRGSKNDFFYFYFIFSFWGRFDR
jgi:hypothetical protein